MKKILTGEIVDSESLACFLSFAFILLFWFLDNLPLLATRFLSTDGVCILRTVLTSIAGLDKSGLVNITFSNFKSV